MSNLTHIEKQKLERELGMGGGYVLNFSNRTFEDFFREIVGVDIYDRRFDLASGSKANRMRAFWDLASDAQVVILIEGLKEAWGIYSDESLSSVTREIFQDIISRLTGKCEPEVPVNEQKQHKNATSVYEALMQKLINLSELDPHARGFAFERFLKDLFEANNLSPKASFRLAGEQIDGSFELRNETYLLEAKWQNSPIGACELHVFEGKLKEKASWSRGLFVSFSGFSKDGLLAFGRGKRVVCMDGLDLSEILRLHVSFEETIALKVRRAAEMGRPHVPFRDLYL